MTSLTEDWPDDADGGVFRRLVEHGFDFSKPHSVDYNVDFESWPPVQVAIELLESLYGPVTLYDPDEHGDGYIQFQIHDRIWTQVRSSTKCGAILTGGTFDTG